MFGHIFSCLLTHIPISNLHACCCFEQGRVPFMVPDRVLWPQLAQALNTKFSSQTGSELSQTNLSYLASKLFGETATGESYLGWGG